MKHTLWICFLLALLVSGCSQDEMLRHDTSASGKGRTFTTEFEQNDSRTYLEDGLYSRWTEGDLIALFDGNTLNRQYRFDGKTGDKSGTFSIVETPSGTSNALSTNYAVYPYASDVEMSDGGVMTVTLPAEQSYAPGSYGLGANTMVAVTHNVYDTFLKFRSVGGCFKLQLCGEGITLKTITLRGNNNEKLAGKAYITAAYDKAPALTMSDDATSSVTLDCGEGVLLDRETPTVFMMVIPPTTFEKGITVTMEDVSGKVYTQSSSKELVVDRNVIKPMAAVEVKDESDATPYITFTADALQTLTMTKAVSTMEYSVNGGEWALLGTTTVSFGGELGNLRLRSKYKYGTSYGTAARIQFGNDIPVACSGDIRTLINYEKYSTVDTREAHFQYLFLGCSSLISAPELPITDLSQGCYYGMFTGCTGLVTAPALPATTLSVSCYSEMFKDCTGLVNPPELPANVAVYGCYYGMFSGCTSLVDAPMLPATIVDKMSYDGMFSGCTSLVDAPSLPATTLGIQCYRSMFSGCTGLKNPPALPATVLTEDCYFEMFKGCTGLVTAPSLPATTLAEGCYRAMFYNCTSLVSSPSELPATTLTEHCYYQMFYNCTSLVNVPSEIPATTLAEYCCYYMFYNCSSLTIAPELPATVLADRCYSCMFSYCTNLVKAPVLRAPVLTLNCYHWMFYGCRKLTSITMLATYIPSSSCLHYWVTDVACSGTFIKSKDMCSLERGISGVPKSWYLKNYGEE